MVFVDGSISARLDGPDSGDILGAFDIGRVDYIDFRGAGRLDPFAIDKEPIWVTDRSSVGVNGHTVSPMFCSQFVRAAVCRHRPGCSDPRCIRLHSADRRNHGLQHIGISRNDAGELICHHEGRIPLTVMPCGPHSFAAAPVSKCSAAFDMP